MDDSQFMKEVERGQSNIHLDFAQNLPHLLHLPEDFIIPQMIKLDQKSALYQRIYYLVSLLDDKIARRQHTLGRNAIMEIEQMEKERVIGWMTVSFLPEIQKYLQENNLSLSKTQIKNIDSFLYLVNANYFEKIQEQKPEARREFLIKQLIHIICIDLKLEGKSSFDEKDAERILKTCHFIPEALKDEIATAFLKAKAKHGENISYEIVRYDIKGGKKAYLEAKRYADEYMRLAMFDIDNINDYIVMIQATEVSQAFQKLEIGSAEDLTWDVEFIQKVVKLMASNYHDELLTLDEEHSNFNLAKSFIFQTMTYAVVNRIDTVTSDVVLKSLANWVYLPFSMKMPIMDDIFTSLDLDYSNHPYRHKQPAEEKQVQKVIQFRPQSTENSD